MAVAATWIAGFGAAVGFVAAHGDAFAKTPQSRSVRNSSRTRNPDNRKWKS
jgi:hypothetical protein